MKTVSFIVTSASYTLTISANGEMKIAHTDNPPAPLPVWNTEIVTAALQALADSYLEVTK